MAIFQRNESGPHGGAECLLIINKAELKIGRSTITKLCAACPEKDGMIKARLDGTFQSGLYMGSDKQPRLKNCKVSSMAFDANKRTR